MLLATLGPQSYGGLWSGATDGADSGITEALSNWASVPEYVKSVYPRASCIDAANLVAGGAAAMVIMGDRGVGYSLR